MPPQPEQGEPLWWLQRLEKQLRQRKLVYDRFDDYYNGKHPLAFASRKFAQAFGGTFESFASNWCALVVDAAAERLHVEGFRLGGGQDERGDADAWRLWQANNLDLDSQMGHVEALIHERAAVLISPYEADQVADGVPAITLESAKEVAVAYQPGSRRRRLAALKLWTDLDGHERANVYLSDAVHKYRSKKKAAGILWAGGMPDVTRWEETPGDGEGWPLANPLGVVPVVELRNRGRLTVDAQSDLATVTPLQDATNKILSDALVASEYAAYPQRWSTGYEVPTDPESGQTLPNAELKAAISRLWTSDDPETKFGQFQAADLSNYVALIELLVQHISSQTRVPPHYFYLSGQFPSGESLKAAETGLVAKVRGKMRSFGETWEEVIRLAFAALGDPRAQAVDAETLWRDPESRSEAELTDATLKQQALGVPTTALWERLGYTPQQIERFQRDRARDALLNQAVDLTGILPETSPNGLPAAAGTGG